MTDTNNTDGAALLPCPNPWCEADDRDGDFRPQVQYSNFGLCYVACTSCKMAGPTRNHEAEAIAAWNTRTPLPATQEDAERSVATFDSIVSVLNSNAFHAALKDPNGPLGHPAKMILSAPAMSDLQRQEYDGEAVPQIDFAEIDAVIAEMIDCATGRGDWDDEEQPDRGAVDIWQSRLQHAAGHHAGFPSRRAGRHRIAADEVLRAALAHPAQARDEMLSGDAFGLTDDEAWEQLVNFDDRTSPAEYPDMALITREELSHFMRSSAVCELGDILSGDEGGD